eukprot:CAMPEP_0170589288 /NCGR_PEP_ID=MMETSP0224-20130122/11272_1 /TAXON_ID=285029 /ORGANISM="Togula jolla, Strain CCCM 725" /LENGTH=330 /DNA_ID=CAMNT_0010913039 /DNA_START=223 /DNA_END=1215 /DNA_ORIENTATION=+
METIKIAVASYVSANFEEDSSAMNCSTEEQLLNCTWFEAAMGSDGYAQADVLFFYIPPWSGKAVKNRSSQLLVVHSIESSVNYPQMNNRSYMEQFDLEVSYRSCSQVPAYYLSADDKFISLTMQEPLAFEKKKRALAYINSNCGPMYLSSGRLEIMREVMKLNKTLHVDSYGACDNNMGGSRVDDKASVIADCMFCVAMENSITKDYVTEKVFDALQAGCIPIYLGAPNVRDFLPDAEAIIDYKDFGTPELLVAEMERLANNKSAYEEKLAWKRRKMSELAPSFLQKARQMATSFQCQLCQLAAERRRSPKNFPEKYTTCLWNSTWMQDA